MKRRVIKKNINRFITPLIKNLPRTINRAIERKYTANGHNMVMSLQKQHIICNGKIVNEGERYFPCTNVLLNIRRTAEEVKRIINSHEYVFVRIEPEVTHVNIVYMRLVTE